MSNEATVRKIYFVSLDNFNLRLMIQLCEPKYKINFSTLTVFNKLQLSLASRDCLSKCTIFLPGSDLAALNTREYVCPNECGRKYKYKGGLNVHLKFECGVPKKFHCKICKRAFAIKSSYKKHMIVKHKIVF